MVKFNVEVKEILSRTVEIEAQNQDDAILLAKQKYDREEIVLDWDDFVCVEVIGEKGS